MDGFLLWFMGYTYNPLKDRSEATHFVSFFVSFIFHIWQGQIWFGWHPKLVCTIFSRTGEYSYSRFFSVLTLPHGYATLRKGSCLEASLKTRIVELVKAKPKHLGAGRWDTMQHLLLLSGFYLLTGLRYEGKKLCSDEFVSFILLKNLDFDM